MTPTAEILAPEAPRAVPVDPLHLAGLRLDAAAAELDRVCQRPGIPEEREFGAAEKAVETARDEYRRLLAERAGQDAEIIERRLQS